MSEGRIRINDHQKQSIESLLKKMDEEHAVIYLDYYRPFAARFDTPTKRFYNRMCVLYGGEKDQLSSKNY